MYVRQDDGGSCAQVRYCAPLNTCGVRSAMVHTYSSTEKVIFKSIRLCVRNYTKISVSSIPTRRLCRFSLKSFSFRERGLTQTGNFHLM